MNQQMQNNYRLPEQNSVVMVGRLTKDPDVRHTPAGKAVCSFDVAMSRRYKDAATGEWKDSDPVFVPVVVWGDQAERCGERLKKGFPVHIDGRLSTNKWTAQDGTTRSRLEVVASRVQFLMITKDNDNYVPTDSNLGGNKEIAATPHVVQDNIGAPPAGSTDSDEEYIPF
ncbi:MAG: single-stranded DNA-binding protein [Elusimicrobiota bacterium]|jgi:single-strand DNA-binding protein|nr:single-stranded DNA-binding protein [Elusimicrobiota bacterium]